MKTQTKVLRRAHEEAPWVKTLLILSVVAVLALMLVLPLVAIFAEAFRKGASVAWAALTEPDAWSAIKLSLFTVAVSLPLNTLFGLAAAWAVTRFEFPGRALLSGLIDLPLWISPVVSGLIYVLVFGAQGIFGPWLIAHGVKIIFTPVAIVLATIFVTFPYVARQVIPVMQSKGRSEEEAALTLGATGFQVFWRVTLPKIKWGLLYGVILCQARALGEFGAVSVVSGHIRGLTNTVPLHIEILYNEYQITAAFAVATLLCFLALTTLLVKALAQWRERVGQQNAKRVAVGMAGDAGTNA